MTRHAHAARLSTALLLSLAGIARGQTVTVNTVDDVVDFAAPQTVAQLPGPDGQVSFREALIAANNTPGPQTVAFAIPQSQWWLLTNIALLRLENGVFLMSGDQTTIDFTTQRDLTGNTNPGGNVVGIYGLEPNGLGAPAIVVSGNNCLIKGLDTVRQRGYGVQISGNNNRVIGCTTNGPIFSAVYISGGFGGPMTSGNVIGGTQPGEGNTLTARNGGVRIDGPARDNIVIGNRLIGATFYGAEVRSAPSSGLFAIDNRIGGPTPAERNLISGNGSYTEEGFPQGGGVNLVSAQGTVIEGNFIGTTEDGVAAYPGQLGPGGIVASDSTGTVIRGNLVSGFAVNGVNHAQGQRFGVGIALTGNTAGSIVQQNLIGTDNLGINPIPSRTGLAVSSTSAAPGNVLIGGPGGGNTVMFNETVGVRLDAGQGVRISGNSVDLNGGLGISLAAGANGSQAFPRIQNALAGAGGTFVSGTLHSLPNQQFSLEFFASPSCDPSGFGEGRAFLGALQVTTDGSGDASFSGTVPGVTQPGASITSTTTQLSTGNTSSFSACVTAGTGSGCYANCDSSTAAPVLNVNDFICFQNRFAAGESYANCDGSTMVPVLNVNDFICFQTRFASGCP